MLILWILQTLCTFPPDSDTCVVSTAPMEEWLPAELRNMTMTWLRSKGRLAEGSDWVRREAKRRGQRGRPS